MMISGRVCLRSWNSSQNCATASAEVFRPRARPACAWLRAMWRLMPRSGLVLFIILFEQAAWGHVPPNASRISRLFPYEQGAGFDVTRATDQHAWPSTPGARTRSPGTIADAMLISTQEGALARAAAPVRSPQDAASGVLARFGPGIIGLLMLALAALAILALSLRREAQRLTAALARARKEHQAAIGALAERQNLETLGRLAAGVAHDMGNVMQAVEFYLRSIPGTLDDRDATLRLVERARLAARRGAVGARDLLGLARGSAQPAEPIDIGSMLSEIAQVMQELFGEGFTVRLALPPMLPHVLADPGDLEAMLVNLATNSRDAMAEAGGGVLAISARVVAGSEVLDAPPDLADGDWVCIEIADTGVGMAPDVLRQATEPFFTTKPRGRGTGLGLALAREFAERSHGLLRIESRPGNGTRTRLYLRPVARPGVDQASDITGESASENAQEQVDMKGETHARG